jgi:hypothetical protein
MIKMKSIRPFLNLLNSILDEAVNEEARAQNGNSRWGERELKNIVIPEMNELKLHADRGDVYYKYGKKQRMLESTYLITDSLNALDSTSLGRKIILLQDMYNAFL